MKKWSREQLDEKYHLKLVKSFSETYDLAKRHTSQAISILVDINRLKWWKKTHTTFEAFCVEVLGISKSHFHRLKEREEVVERIPEECRGEITNERQARALSDVPTNKLGDVIKLAKEASKNGHISAANLEKAKSQISVIDPTNRHPLGDGRVSVKSGSKPPKSAKVVVLDDTDIPVPEEAIPYWKRKEEIQALLSKLSDVKCAIEKAKRNNDPMYGGVSNNFVVDMRSAYAHLKDGAMPYAVCTQCQGSPSLQPEGCSFCSSTGLIPEWKWNTQALKEVKEMRKKIAADLAKERG